MTKIAKKSTEKRARKKKTTKKKQDTRAKRRAAAKALARKHVRAIRFGNSEGDSDYA